MPFTNYAVDNFISPNLSQLTECNAPDLASRFPNAESWFVNFILNSMYGHPIGEEGRKFCYLFLRKAEAAFINYGLARAALEEFIGSLTDGNRRLVPYFRALHFFEATLAVWQTFQIFSRISNEKYYQKGDGSDYEKLNNLYNISRHTNPAGLPPKRLHAIWITNNGLETEDFLLPFNALEKLMIEVGDLAESIASCEWHQAQSEADQPAQLD